MNVDHDWLVNDALVGACNFVCQYVDRLSHLIKVVELLIANFLKSCPRLSGWVVQMH